PRTHSHARGQTVDGHTIQRALVDQSQGAPHDRGSATPSGSPRGRLGAAAQTGTKARLGRRCGRGVVAHVRALARGRRAHRPAVNAGGDDRNEEFTVETWIAAETRTVKRLAVEVEKLGHVSHDTRAPDRRLAVFGRYRRSSSQGSPYNTPRSTRSRC